MRGSMEEGTSAKKGHKKKMAYTKVTSLILLTLIATVELTPLVGVTMGKEDVDAMGVETTQKDTTADEEILEFEVIEEEEYVEEIGETIHSELSKGEVNIVEPKNKPLNETTPEDEENRGGDLPEVNETGDLEKELNVDEVIDDENTNMSTRRTINTMSASVQTTNQYVMATDEDFSGTTNGTFRYVGDADYVEIPHVIKGVNVTSYSRMFEETGVKGVKSTNNKVTSMSNMFRKSKSLTLDVSQLETSAVTTMSYMFAGVDGGNSKIKEISGLENFDTSKVRDMASMFSTSDVEKLDLSSFDTSSVTTMTGMFYVCMASEIKGLENFDTTNVVSMGSMFASSRATKLDLSSFNTGNVTNMSVMFMNSYATEIKGLENFNTTKVDTMSRMFEQTRVSKFDLSSFNTQNVVTMNGMFRYAGALGIDISNFNTAKVRDMGNMFAGTEATTINLGNMDTRNVTSMYSMFEGSKANVIDVRSFDTTKVSSMKDMFYNTQAENIIMSTGFKTHNTTNMSYMFAKTNARELDLSSFDTSKVTMMDSMFSGAKAGNIKGLTNFNTSNVVDMGNMFNGAKATKLELSNFNTQKVENMVNMFKDTSVEELDLSSFDTTKITDMGSLFEGSKAKRVDVSSFTTTNVYNMSKLFKDTNIGELDLSSFDMSSVNDTTDMFTGTKTTKGLAKSKDDANILNRSSGKPSTLEFKPKYEVATDEDFSGTLNGYFRYTGDAEFVEVPHVIKGVNVNNYTSMFAGTSVRGVVSTNPKVTNMSYMFDGNTATSLDIRGLNTDNVSQFEGMFKDTKTPKLDLSTLNTQNVVNTSRMFENAMVDELDLGSFDVTKTYKLDNMFKGVNARKGYARTAEDAVKLNNSSNKPAGLNFTVWGLTTEQVNTEWTNESVTIKVKYNNDHYGIDYMELMNGEGRNLLTGSHFDKGIGELLASSAVAEVKDSIYKLTPQGNNVNYTYTDMRKNLVPGETYTLSLKHRNNVPFQFRGGVNVSGYDGTVQPTDDWKVSHITFKTVKTDVILRLYFAMGYGVSTSNLEIDWIKLEKGSKPTPWSVAPEDDEVVNNTKEYQVPVNGSYVFRVTDKAGNTKTVAHTVTNIDTVNPTAELTKSTEGWTSQDVSIYVNAKDELSGVQTIELPDGTKVSGTDAEYKATSNGVYTFKVTDKAGNTITKTAEVTNIDRSVPKLNADVDNKEWTRDPINIKVTSEESASGLTGIIMKSSPWEGRNLIIGSDEYVTDKTPITSSVLKNYNQTKGDLIEVLKGKTVTTSIEAEIDNYQGGRLGYESEYITLPWNSNYVVERAWIGESYKNATVGKPFTGRITYTREVPDDLREVYSRQIMNQLNGNPTFKIGRPKFEIGTKATPWTPAPEDIQLIGNTKTYPVVANGLYTFESTYNNGTTSEVSVNVTNIDLEKPTLTVADNPIDWVEDDKVTLKINAKDTLSGVYSITLPNGEVVKTATATYDVTKNGTYEFKVTDNVGNMTIHKETVRYLMVGYNFYVYDKNNNPVEGAEFELLRDGESYKKATSGSDGLVDFGKIPPEGKYTIRQTTAPGGVVINPEDIESGDITEPVEVIIYPRGTELPSTGTLEMAEYLGVIQVTIIGIVVIKKRKAKVK